MKFNNIATVDLDNLVCNFLSPEALNRFRLELSSGHLQDALMVPWVGPAFRLN